MKTLTKLCVLVALSVSSSTLVWSQTTHTITLHVNTAEISDSNLSKTCNFGQPADVSNEDFNIDVQVGDEIIWEIKAIDSDQEMVSIENIKYEKGRNLFNKSKINRKDGFVKGRILVGAKGQFQKYSIKFKVKGRGTFVIDPKITIKT